MDEKQLDTLRQRVRAYYDKVDELARIKKDGTFVFEINQEYLQKIGNIFADDAVYERKGVEDGCYKGKNTIVQFFHDKRSLLGQHQIEEPVVRNGLPYDNIAESTRKYFPDLDPNECVTVKVKGKLIDTTLCSRDKDRHLIWASRFTNPIKFEDYWVMQNGKIKYRHSIVKLDLDPPARNH